jgi:hypothetical protein
MAVLRWEGEDEAGAANSTMLLTARIARIHLPPISTPISSPAHRLAVLRDGFLPFRVVVATLAAHLGLHAEGCSRVTRLTVSRDTASLPRITTGTAPKGIGAEEVVIAGAITAARDVATTLLGEAMGGIKPFIV